MSEMEQVELTRYRREILEDMRHMLRKYCRIMEWDVPDIDEKAARRLIVQTLREALVEVEKEA
jgi:hypothetical protein